MASGHHAMRRFSFVKHGAEGRGVLLLRHGHRLPRVPQPVRTLPCTSIHPWDKRVDQCDAVMP